MKAYWTYFVASLVSLLAVDLFVYTQGWYLLQITGQKLSVGVALGVLFIPSLFLLPLMGRLLDSQRLKATLMLFEIGKAAVLVVFLPLLYWAPSGVVVYLMSGLFGIFFSTFYPAMYVVLKRVVPPGQETKYSHLFEVSIQISSIIAVLLAGVLYERFGFLWLMALGAVLLLTATAMLATIPFAADDALVKSDGWFAGYRRIGELLQQLRRREVRWSGSLTFGIFHQFPQNVIFMLNVPILLYVYESMKKGPVEYSILDGVFSVVSMGVGFLWATFHVASRRRSVLVGATVLSAASLALLWLVPARGVWPYAVFAVIAFCICSSKILCRAAAVRIIPAKEMGSLASFYQTCNYAMLIAMLFLVGYVAERVEARTIFLGVGGAMLLFAAFLTRVRAVAENA